MADFTPELNHVSLKSPTEDGKLAYVMNTMVPRRLDQFDDIRNDLANKNFNTDRAFFYVNFQAGDFCGRSYKLPLSELNEFVTKSLLFGTNGKEPVLKFDENFYVDSENMIHLIVDGTNISLQEFAENVYSNINELFGNLYNESQARDSEDVRLDTRKQDKLIVMGDGDVLNAEGLPEPATGVDGYGVHVTYSSEGPDLGDGTKGSKIVISHDAVVPEGGWISKYAVGGIAIGQAFPEGTKITEVWRQLLEGDPKADNVLCAAVSSTLPQYWTDIAWRQFTVKRNELVRITGQSPLTWESIPFDQWKPVIANNQYIMISVPLSMIYEPGTDIVMERPVKLAEVYNVSSPAFTYDWKEYDIKNNPNATENGYRVYYITNKVTTETNDLVWEFTNNG